ncbi:MAG: D-alanine--poly(phosphoribitol) ligase subunit DltA [Lachnospiraceae bacterium]|nr:D-alanine--poly(phosphoribitol) ligase subunit DltA [Lachnospiraceae bacterium]
MIERIIENSNPDKIAIIYQDYKITYGQMLSIARNTANLLLEHGYSKGGNIGIYMDVAPETVAICLGILSAGCTMVPLNISEPAVRNKKKIIAADIHFIFTKESSQELTRDFDGVSYIIDQEKENNLSVITDSENNKFSDCKDAYILFTSGTTGEPKGIINTMENLLEHTEIFIHEMEIVQDDIFMGFSPLHFDCILEVVFPILMAGGTLIIPDVNQKTDCEYIYNLIIEQNVTILSAPPQILNILNKIISLNEKLGNVRLILVGGDIVKYSNLDRLIKGSCVRCGYGLTEATVSTLWHTITEKDTDIVPIGKPLSKTFAYILDEHGNHVPEGMAGEIYLGGAGIAKGYLNDAELTAGKFIADPFNGGKMLRTGDMGKFNERNEIIFLGRKDNQVSIMGVRVELAEIEAVLIKYDSIEECYVESRGEEKKFLVCYLVLKGNQKINYYDFISYFTKILPLIMLPKHFYHADSIPRLDTGKIDYRALTDREWESAMVFKAAETALNFYQNAVKDIWKRTLRTDMEIFPIDIDFYEMGGDSILAIKVISDIASQFHIDITVKEFVNNPTIDLLAIFIERKVNNGVEDNRIKKAKKKEFYKTTAAQKRIWIVSQIEDCSSLYNTITNSRLKGKLNVNRFIRAFQTLFDSHEILHANFYEKDNDILQKVNPGELKFEYADIRNMKDKDEYIFQYINSELEYNFDLEKEILVRPALMQTKDEEYHFILNVHHIVTDNQSWIQMLSELETLYENNGKPDSAEKNISYFDFAEYEKELRDSDQLIKQKRYWLQKMDGIQDMLTELNLTRKRSDIIGLNGHSQRIQLDRNITRSIKNLARQERVSPYSCLLSVLKLLIYKYTGQEDIIIGSPVINRKLGKTKSLIGLFLNIICVRSRVNPDEDFIELLHKVHDLAQEAIDNQDYPFENIIEDLKIERKTSQTPLFQILFDYHGDDTEIFKLRDIEVENLPVKSIYSKNEMTFTVIELNGTFWIDCEYNLNLYDQLFVSQLMERYEILLRKVLKDNRKKLKAYDLLSVADIKTLKNYNETQKLEYAEENFIQLFEKQAALNPDKAAYIYLDKTITYNELNQKANQCSAYMQSRGIRAADVVALYMDDKSIDTLILILGIIKMGAAYLPLDVSHPAKHIKKLIDTASPICIITESDHIENLRTDIDIYCADSEFWNGVGTKSNTNPKTNHIIDNIFHIIFTSGSTGTPKGVQTKSSAIVNRLKWAWDTMPFKDGDIMAHHKSYALIGSFVEMFGGLLRGVPTVIIPRQHVLSGMLLDDIVKHQITYFFASPPILTILMDEGRKRDNSDILLRYTATSAEPVSIDFVRKWYDIFPNTRLINLYGSTENCSDIAYYDTKLMGSGETAVPAGYPIANAKIYIIDNDDNILPTNINGKIIATGVPVSSGYINNEELTAQVFRNIKLLGEEKEPVYYTGDNGWLDEQGRLIITGRYDFQENINGYLIGTDDIELALKECAEIKQTAVIITETAENEKKIVAYIVNRDKAKSIKFFRDSLKQRLPEYMIPSKFVFTDNIPRTPNGKIDRKALPDASLYNILGVKYMEPRTPIEQNVREIFENVLKVNKIGVYDNFFDIGGDSIKAIQIIGHIRHIFSVNLPIMELFSKPTIADMSEYISNAERNYKLNYEMVSNEPRKVYPISYVQEGFYFYNKLEPRNIFYNIAANRIEGRFDLDIFKKSLTWVMLRHDALRMLFIEVNGRAEIVISSQVEPHIQEIDLSHLEEGEKSKEVIRLSRKEIDSSFDFYIGPLLRVKCYKLGQDDIVVLINMSHIVTDGRSINILLKEVSYAYKHYIAGAPFELPPLPIQFSDFIIWQKSEYFNEIIEKQKGYWREALKGKLPVLNLKGKARPEVFTYKGGIVKATMAKALTEQLKQLGYQYKSTLYMVLLAIYNMTLYIYTKNEDIIVGSPIAGRGYPQVENLIGCFVNTICIRINCDNNMSFDDLIEHVREKTLGAFSNSDVPFDELVKMLNPSRDLSRGPIFQSMMTMQDNACNLLDLKGTKITDAGVINDLAPYDLSVIIWVEENQTVFYTEYYSDVFTQDFVEGFLEDYFKIAALVLENPKMQISNINLINDDKSEALLKQWVCSAEGLSADQATRKALDDANISYENKRFLILNENRKPVKEGMVGEICLVSKQIDFELASFERDVLGTQLPGYYYDNIIHSKEDIKQADEPQAEISNEELTEYEDGIRRIWEKLLERNINDITANFFDSGGSSLMIIAMIEMINQEYDISLSIASVFKYPSIRSLASQIFKLINRTDESNEKSNINKSRKRLAKRSERIQSKKRIIEEKEEDLVIVNKIREGNSGVTVVCIGPVNAVSPKYVKDLFHPLTEAMSKEISVSYIKLNISYQHDLKEYISRCVEKVIPLWENSNNFFLVGWCTGGLIAHEMAHVLEREGRITKQVFLLDTYEPDYAKEFKEKKFIFDDKEITYSQVIYVIEQMDVQKNNNLSLVEKELSTIAEKSSVCEFIFEKLSNLNMAETMLKRVLKVNIDLTDKLNLESTRLCSQYQSSDFYRNTTLMIPKTSREHNVDQYLGWKRVLSGKIDVQYIEGIQKDMLIGKNALHLTNSILNLRKGANYD